MMHFGTFRPNIVVAILVAGVVAACGVLSLDDPDHIVTICTGVSMAILGLGNKIVEADLGPDEDR